MSPVTKNFIRASLIYLLFGVTLGFLFMLRPVHEFIEKGPAEALVWVHAHLNLVGFVSMMIFGVAYHILPRFSGRPLHSERLAQVHFILSNTSLIGLLLSWGSGAIYGGLLFQKGQSWAVIGKALAPFLLLAAIFGALLVLSFFLFVYNLFRTLR